MSHDSHDRFGEQDVANRAAIQKHDRIVAARQRPAAKVMRWVAFIVGVLLCWLYAETLATSWANGYGAWMKTEKDLWFGIDHFLVGFAVGIIMVVAGGFLLVRTNGSHRLLVIASSALWLFVMFMPLCGAIVLFNQHLAR